MLIPQPIKAVVQPTNKEHTLKFNADQMTAVQAFMRQAEDAAAEKGYRHQASLILEDVYRKFNEHPADALAVQFRSKFDTEDMDAHEVDLAIEDAVRHGWDSRTGGSVRTNSDGAQAAAEAFADQFVQQFSRVPTAAELRDHAVTVYLAGYNAAVNNES